MGFVVLLAAAGLLGAQCARLLGLRMNADGVALRLLMGYAVCAVATVAIGSVSLALVRAALLVIAVIGLGVDVRWAARKRKRVEPANDHRPYHLPSPLSAFERACAATVIFNLSCAFIGVLAPITSWDAAVAHLALPATYVRNGAIGLVEGNAYSAYPQFLHSLFTAAYLLGGELAVALCNYSIVLAGVVVMFTLGNRLAGRRCGWTAAAIFATAPIFSEQAGTVSIDLAFAVYTLAALLALVSWKKDKRVAWLICAAVLAGSSCGIRHTGYLTCLLMAIWVLTEAAPRFVRPGFLFALVGILTAMPWLLRSYLLTGNAFYPFFHESAGAGPADAAITGLAAHESIRGMGLVPFATFPFRLIMQPYRFDGLSQSPGPWVLLLGVPGIFFGRAAARRLGAFGILGGACLFFFRQYARYYLPFFVPMMAVAAVGAERTPWWRRTITVLLCCSFLYGSAYAFAAIHFKIPVAFRLESRDTYMKERVERYEAYAWLNENLPDGVTVLTTDMRGYYIQRPVFQNLEALYPIMNDPVWQQLGWMEERGIDYWLYCDAYVDESPGFREKGLYYLFQHWRQDARFTLVKTFHVSRPGSQNTETVELYRIRYD